MSCRTIMNINQASFAKYGTVIEFTPQMSDGWEILVKAENSGWRIALLEFAKKTANVLEYHPDSKESFEPVKGTALLIVAENHTPEDFEVFLLDKPVCLNEGVWHQVISLSEVSQVKITENLEVTCVYHSLTGEAVPALNY